MGLIRWLGYQTDELVSPLSIIECINRLRSATQSEWAIFGTSPVVGKVGEKSFRLRKRLKMSHNSFQTHLSASLSSEGTSTRVTCRFGMHPFVVIFMIVWLGAVTGGAIGSLVFGLRHSNGTMPSAAGLVPWGLALFGIVLVGVGRGMARGEREFLMDFLRQTVEARPDMSRSRMRVETVVRR